MKKKEKLVFCKYCRYYNKPNCEAPENMDIKKDFYSSFVTYIDEPMVINKDNKCKLYKQKWWRYVG